MASSALALASGAQSTKLNLPLPGPSSDVTQFAADPSGTVAYYVADQDQAGVFELYRVPIEASSPPARLSTPMPSSSDVQSATTEPAFRVAPTGRVVYCADAVLDGRLELFSVPGDGSQAPVALCPSITSGGSVWRFVLTPDGSRVVYVADQDADDVFELYCVPTDGSAPAHRVNGPLGAGEDIFTFFVDPTSTYVAYATTLRAGGLLVNEVFAARLDGSTAPVSLATHTLSYLASGVNGITFSPDGAWMAYFVTHLVGTIQNITELYVVPVDGSLAPRQLAAQNATKAAFTPDGSRLVFSLSSSLCSTTPTGPVTVLDSSNLGAIGSWLIDSSGSTVFFVDGGSVQRVPVDGSGPPVVLSVTPGETLRNLRLSPDGQWLAYSTLDPGPFQVSKLNSVPTGGGATRRLAYTVSSPSSYFGDVWIDADSQRVVYRVTENFSSTIFHLHVARIDGKRPPLRLDEPGPADGSVAEAVLLPGVRVLYRASQDTSGVFELYTQPLGWPGVRAGSNPRPR